MNYPLQKKLDSCESKIRSDIARFIKNYKGMGKAVWPEEKEIKERALRSFIKSLLK